MPRPARTQSAVLSALVAACLALVGCRELAGYGPASSQSERLDLRAGDQRTTGADSARAQDAQAVDGARDGLSIDLGGCPCSGGCPPAGTCDIPCVGGVRHVCPPGYDCRFQCGTAVALEADCRLASKCVVECDVAGACSWVRCGGDCEVACAGDGSCPSLTLIGGSGATRVRCAGGGSCSKAKILGGAGHARVECTGTGSCTDAVIDLSSGCGGLIECKANCSGATTTCPAGCQACVDSDCQCP